MLLDQDVRRIAGKELAIFFASPIAWLFLGSFVAVTLFIFFWGEAFFARNIADVRPMFEWLPVLLIFLSAALSMRLWSEERRTGTLEFVSTLPVASWRFVWGKFLACMVLLALALALTLPLPVTVDWMADLDWGPVWAGYLASLLLGAVYLSAGLFVSSRTDNQIVALILSTLLGGALYLVGSPVLTDLAGNTLGEWMRSLSTGARFEAIARGVVDFRDLYYYLGLTVVFLVLNVYGLEHGRWARGDHSGRHARWRWVTALAVANVLLANGWLSQIDALRWDVTAGKQYSLSAATRNYLDQLQEPLLIRGYVSAKTHPLLAPLVPALHDLLKEYEAASDGRVRVEWIDPARAPALEEEANTRYGIRPTPFQVQDRYQASLVNSYFDLLVQYGDSWETLGFRDLIEIRVRGEADLDVRLRNPEYDVTRAIRKVLYAFQSGGNPFNQIDSPVRFSGFISADEKLPAALRALRSEMTEVLDRLEAQSGDKFSAQVVDPAAGDGSLAAELKAEYGFLPMAASVLDTDTFYFYMVLEQGERSLQIPLPEDFSKAGLERGIEAALKRFARGLTKQVALVAPRPANPYLGGGMGKQFDNLRQWLGDSFAVVSTDLASGQVPAATDILVLVAPEELDKKQLFAVDQFLMRGGTVVIASSPFTARLANQQLMVAPQESGLEGWLKHHGLRLDHTLVLDTQNAAFPIPVTRQVGGYSFQEVRMLDYPYFVDVRGEGLNSGSPVTADIHQLTMTWASPIETTAGAEGKQLTPLLRSSANSWLSNSTDVMPRLRADGSSGFVPEGEQAARNLGVILEGRFSSYFAGQPSPLLAVDAAPNAKPSDETDDEPAPEPVISSVIEHSPDSARIVLFSSNEFLTDQTLTMAASVTGTEELAPLQLLVNTLEWAVQDDALAGIRSRAHFNRSLPPLAPARQQLWEYLNYGLAVLALAGLGLWVRLRRQRRTKRYQAQLAQYSNQSV